MAVFPPDTMALKCGYANFGAFAADLMKREGKPGEPNPNTSTYGQESRKAQLHRRLGLDWYYGGWMEDRTEVWSETYLKLTQKFLHIGVDCSVKALTPVLAVEDGPVLISATDAPEVGGWGGFVSQQIRFRGEDMAVIYGHLGVRTVKTGEYAGKGQIIGYIGTKEENGGWGEHLHIQLVRDVGHVTDWWQFWDKELDGYEKAAELSYWASRCPDPTCLIF